MSYKAKRAFDIAGASVGIVIFGIPCVVAAGALTIINRESPIYKQLRVGLDGKEFTMYKLKTAPHKCDEDDNLLPLTERIGRVGKFLRTCKIDEIPNFINVLKGDMSLVGPRSLIHPDRHNGEIIALDKKRCSVLPGMTGLTQIIGTNELTDAEILKYDHRYVDKKSLRCDLIIAALTIPSIPLNYFKKVMVKIVLDMLLIQDALKTNLKLKHS